MERAKEIGDQLLWLIGHLAFTLAVNLMVFGGYHAWQAYQGKVAQPSKPAPKTQMSLNDLDEFNFEGLSIEQLQELEVRVQEAQGAPRGKNKG